MFTSGSQCIAFLLPWVARPPRTLRFDVPSLRQCTFLPTKVMLRIVSVTDPLAWDCVLVYRKNRWQVAGGTHVKAAWTRKPSLTTVEVVTLLCESLIHRKGRARLEVDLTFDAKSDGCDYIDWDVDTDLAVKRTTTLKAPRHSLRFDAQSTFPADRFECTTTELKFVFDFARQRQVSIWEEEELRFQERARYTRRS